MLSNLLKKRTMQDLNEKHFKKIEAKSYYDSGYMLDLLRKDQLADVDINRLYYSKKIPEIVKFDLLVAAPKIPTQILESAAKAASQTLRVAAAQAKNLPKTMQPLLAKDVSGNVRREIAERLDLTEEAKEIFYTKEEDHYILSILLKKHSDMPVEKFKAKPLLENLAHTPKAVNYLNINKIDQQFIKALAANWAGSLETLILAEKLTAK